VGAVEGEKVGLAQEGLDFDLVGEKVFVEEGFDGGEEAGVEFEEGAIGEFEDVEVGGDAAFGVEEKGVDAGVGGEGLFGFFVVGLVGEEVIEKGVAVFAGELEEGALGGVDEGGGFVDGGVFGLGKAEGLGDLEVWAVGLEFGARGFVEGEEWVGEGHVGIFAGMGGGSKWGDGFFEWKWGFWVRLVLGEREETAKSAKEDAKLREEEKNGGIRVLLYRQGGLRESPDGCAHEIQVRRKCLGKWRKNILIWEELKLGKGCAKLGGNLGWRGLRG
jgi:hypothetical protein